MLASFAEACCLPWLLILCLVAISEGKNWLIVILVVFVSVLYATHPVLTARNNRPSE